jgi:hypothetical protein
MIKINKEHMNNLKPIFLNIFTIKRINDTDDKNYIQIIII